MDEWVRVEDTFLLMDALESERAYLIERVKPRVAIEIGYGVSTHSLLLIMFHPTLME